MALNFRIVFVFFVSSFFLLANLHLSPVFQVSEGREGVVVQEMIRSSDYILPLRHAQIIPSKPVFFHSLSTIPYKFFGENNPVSLRLVSALSSIGLCLVLYLTASKISGTLSGIFSVGVLLSTYGFVHLAKDGRVDMLFSFFMLSSICIWLTFANTVFTENKSPFEISNKVYLTSAILMGLAVLVKGPLGVVLPLLAIFSISSFHWGKEGFLSCLRGVLIIAFIVPFPWYLLASIQGGSDFIFKQILFENIFRFIGGEGVNSKPFWFYFVEFWSHLAPCSVIFISFVFLLKMKSEKNYFENNFITRSCLIWFLVVLAFLTISSGKRRAYLLTLIPAVALYLGVVIGNLYQKLDWNKFMYRKTCIRALSAIWVILSVFSICFFLIISSSVFTENLFNNRRVYSTVIASREFYDKNSLYLYFVFSLLSFFSFYALNYSRKKNSKKYFFISFFLLAQFCLFGVASSLLAIKGHSHSYENFANNVNSYVSENEPIFFIKSKKDESFDAFFFYLNRQVFIRDFSDQSEMKKGFYLTREKWLRRISKLPKVKTLISGKRLIDLDSEKLVLFKLK